MSRSYKMPRKYSRHRKNKGVCEKCGKKCLDTELYQKIDESNIAISYYAPYLCIDCYRLNYGK